MTDRLVALVTGASSGIGQATATKLAAAGYTVYGTSRRGTQSGQLRFPMLALEVTDDSSVEAAIAELLRLEVRIDVLVNNAGLGVAPAAAEEISIEQAKAIVDTNFLGIVRMTRAVPPHIRRQSSGRIINIGSILGVRPTPYMSLYTASKQAGIIGSSRSPIARAASGFPLYSRRIKRSLKQTTLRLMQSARSISRFGVVLRRPLTTQCQTQPSRPWWQKSC